MRVRVRKESKLIPSIRLPPFGPGETRVVFRKNEVRNWVK
jgi:hypothetical protein